MVKKIDSKFINILILYSLAYIFIFLFKQDQRIDLDKIRRPIRRDHLPADRILKRLGFGNLPDAKPIAGHWYRVQFRVLLL